MAKKAARKLSQVASHMAIAFVITYMVTGSVLFGGLATLIEPVINVLLVPQHERIWNVVKRLARPGGYVLLALEKTSLALMHAGVAFAVMYWATGSVVFGGLAAVLEPICNVILMPLHERVWDKIQAPRFQGA